jgi:hypothetical protein
MPHLRRLCCHSHLPVLCHQHNGWIFKFFYYIIVVLGVHCDIYKSSFFFHFHIRIHNISNIFNFLHSFFLSSALALAPPTDRNCFTFLFSVYEQNIFLFVSDSFTRSILVTFPCIYVL